MFGIKRDKIVMDRKTYTIMKWDYKNKVIVLWPDHCFHPVNIPMYYLLKGNVTRDLGIKWVLK